MRYKGCIMLRCLIKINISNLVILKIFYTFAFVKYKNKINYEEKRHKML